MVYPARHGVFWSESEVKALKLRFNSGVKIQEIARTHERTVRSIEMALEKFVLRNSEVKKNQIIINGKNYSEKLDLAVKVVEHRINYLVDLAKLRMYQDKS